jgi:ATP-binding cassette subfamily B protein
MTGALLSVVVAATLNAGTSYIFKLIVNAASALARGGAAVDLWHSLFLYIVVSAVSTLAWRASGFIGMYWSTGVRATSRYALSSYVTRHSHEYFSNRFAGSLLSKISNAAGSTKDMTEQILWQFTGFAVTMIASFSIIYTSSHILAAVFLGWIALITPLNFYFARKRVPLSSAAQKAETALGGATVDMLTNISAVYEYARRPFELLKLRTLILARRTDGLRNWRFGESILLLNGVLQTLFIGGLLILTVHYTLIGRISPGDIVLVLTLIMIVEDRLTFIGQQINNFADAWGQVSESLQDILVTQEVPNVADAKALKVTSGNIFFVDTTFAYGGAPVFNKLSLNIPGGQKVGLVGRSGAGKSTLIKLLLRHYDLTSGSIIIDDMSIADVTKESLRSQIAVVPQEPLLFHRTIRENIAYGKLDATEEEIIRAATLAEAHQFITQLTDGYNSLVGERGVKLSGGQRQRVVIARALLKNSRILLLDEATSSLDSESEIAVQKALLTLMEHRTVIAIAHRLSTLRAMDRIIVMDKGAIIEDGTHDALLEKGGLYATLWNHQAGGFLEE